MTINILMFEFRDAEQKYFDKYKDEHFKITFYKECLNEDFLKKIPQEILDNTTVISVFINSKISKEILSRFKNLRIISTRSTAYDHICLEACSEKNIALLNVPDYGKTSVAQYTMGLIVALVRKIVLANFGKTHNVVDYNSLIGRDLSALTLGVIGTGAIGSAVCEIAKSFGMNVLGHDLNKKQELVDKFALEYVSCDEIAKNSDVITLHLPYYPKTKFIIDENFLSKCKSPVYIVNTSQPELVDLKSVVKYLKSGKIRGFGMDFLRSDVIDYACENMEIFSENKEQTSIEQNKYFEQILEFENVIITPHIAYLTQDAIDTILNTTFTNIKKVIQGDKLCRIV